jgi:hypothetical protein
MNTTKLDFGSYASVEEATAAIHRSLPPGTSRDVVIKAMEDSGGKCYSENGGLFCVLDEPTRNMVYVAWRLSFGFDANGRLLGVGINRGLTGL